MIHKYASCFALLFFVGASIAHSSEPSRLEIGFRDTFLGGIEDQTSDALNANRPIPATIYSAGARIFDVLPALVQRDLREAMDAAAESVHACRGELPGRARAIVFAETYWRVAATGKLAEDLKGQVPPEVVELIFVGFYESLLNQFANAWNMRLPNSSSALLKQCKSHGVEDVTPCLNVALLHEAAKQSGVNIDVHDFAFVYLPQVGPPESP